MHNRLVLNHQIFTGAASQSFDVGLLNLERRLNGSGHATEAIWERRSIWPDFGEAETLWRRACVRTLRQSLAALAQFVDIGTIVLSSYAPKEICQAICDELNAEVSNVDAIAGTLETAPKATGAASLPFSSKFMVE